MQKTIYLCKYQNMTNEDFLKAFLKTILSSRPVSFFCCKKEMLSKYVAWSLVCHIICIFVRKNKRIYLCYSNKTLRTCHFKWHDLDSNYFRKQTKLYFEIMFNCGMIFKPNFIASHMTAKLNIVLKLWVIKFPIKLNCPRKCWLSSK